MVFYYIDETIRCPYNNALMIKKDAYQYARHCNKGQRYATIHIASLENLTFILNPWPFAIWGIDLIGPLHLASGGFKWVIVAVDYYTK